MNKKLVLLIFAFFFLLNDVYDVSAESSLDKTVQYHLGNDNVSVSFRTLDNEKLLFVKNGDVPMKPASTLKLLTAAAALDILGHNYRFHTKMYLDGEIDGNVLNGDIYIKGEGDPTLQKRDFITFASVLKQQGIRQINGNLYGDDSLFLGEQLTPGISKEDESYYFAARTTALTMSPNNDYDAGTIILNLTATNIGKPPSVLAEPNASGMIIQNHAITVNQNQKNTIEIERQYGTDKIVITGNIPIDTTFKDWVTLYDPTINTLKAIKSTFEDFGLSFYEETEINRKTVPFEAKNVYIKNSLPLKSLIVPFLKLSNNSIADILVKTMGNETYGKGYLDNGLNALRDYGVTIGLNMENWRFEDGSGMSHTNSVTANELTLLLTKIQADPNYNILYSSLPIGGQSDRLIGGSLRKRFSEVAFQDRVIAKTGHISGVYTLAGYVKANSGRTYAFAIMTQNQTSIKLSAIDAVVKNIITSY